MMIARQIEYGRVLLRFKLWKFVERIERVVFLRFFLKNYFLKITKYLVELHLQEF